MIFTVIDPTGEIVSVLNVPDEEHAQLNTPTGCTALEGPPAYPDGYWNGTAWIERPAPPNQWDVWDVNGKQWVDQRTLDEVKADQWNLVKTGRDAVLYSTLTWSGSVFQIDPESQQRIQGAVLMARIAQDVGQTTWSVDWTLADNTVRTLSIADMVNVGLALGAFYEANWNQGTALRNQINAAQNATDVEAIVWAPPS